MEKNMKGKLLLLFIPAMLLASPCRGSGEHPSLGVSADSLSDLRARIASDPVAGGWMDSVRRDAEDYLAGSTACGDFSDESDISWAAAFMAFAMLIDDDARFAAPVAALLGCAGFYNGDDRDTFGWVWGGDLLRYGFAYDWAEPYFDAAQDTAARTALLDAMRVTMPIFERPPISGSDPIKYYTNVRMRIGAGMGVASMALTDDAEAAAWLDYIVEDFFSDAHDVDYYINIVLTPDGTYNEGPSYQNDSFSVYLPFLLAYRDLSGIDLTGEHGTPGTGLWSDGRVRRMFYTNLCMMTPERLPPTIDTGWRYGTDYHELVIPLLDEPERSELQWFWEEAVGTPTFILGSILWADTSVGASAPTWTSCRTSDYAVLRSGWGREDIFLMVQSDHLPARSTHVQPDQTSVLLFAEGQYVLIDPGDGRSYGGTDPRHTWLRLNPSCHNLVLVDGLEAPDYASGDTAPARVYSNTDVIDPASQEAFFQSDLLDLVTVTLTYSNVPDVTIARTAALVRDRYVVLGDDLVGSSGHVYEALLHFGGPAGETAIEGTLTLDGGAMTWETANEDGQAIALRAGYFPEPETVTAREDGKTNYTPSVTFDHTYTRARYSGAAARFLSVIDVINVDAGDAPLSPAAIAAAGGTALEVDAGDGRDLWLFSASAGEEIEIPSEGITASTSFACLQLGAVGGLAQAAAVRFTSITLGGALLAGAAEPASLRFEPGHEVTTGEAWSDSGTQVTIASAFEPAAVLVNGLEAAFSWDAGPSTVSFSIPAGYCAFSIHSEPVPADEDMEPLPDGLEPPPDAADDSAGDASSDDEPEGVGDGGSGGCGCTI